MIMRFLTTITTTSFKLKNWAKVSNFVRFLAIQQHGGFYPDTDVELLKPLDFLRHESCFLNFNQHIP